MGKRTMLEIIAEKQAKLEEARRLHEKGMGFSEIARRVGMSVEWVRQRLRDDGEPMTAEEVREFRKRLAELPGPGAQGDPPYHRSALAQREQT